MNDKMIDASYSYRTYAGCLEGTPTPKSLIKDACDKAKELWGYTRPTLVIEPTVKSKRLPTWTHMIWATGPAKSEEMHGSHLVILWWSEFEPDTKRVLDAVDWNKHAQDFQY